MDHPNSNGGSLTTTNTRHDGTAAGPSSREVGILRLRGGSTRARGRVVWTDDTVDNEGCGRKSSKICCIYHKPRNFDESSSEDDSSSSDSGEHSESDIGDSREIARRRLAQRERERERQRADVDTHGDEDECGQEHDHTPNAYEKIRPSSSRKGKERAKTG
ncbi:Type 1 phosphatase regulator ypi1 [Mycena kentingensis (nom. inval.)]|nr:Type 1 phosphatase regulator ypi1 [Mycena kentingensis (nom. inval.)]